MLAPRDKLWTAPDFAVDAALSLLSLSSSDCLVDFGCGNGVALLAATRRFGCSAVGYEICEERAAQLRVTVADAGLSDRVTVHCKNALEADPREPTAVYMYLISRGLKLMLPILQAAAACQPEGSLRVVTMLYRIPDVSHDTMVKVPDPDNRDIMFPIYVYTIRPVVEDLSASSATAVFVPAGANTGVAVSSAAAEADVISS